MDAVWGGNGGGEARTQNATNCGPTSKGEGGGRVGVGVWGEEVRGARRCLNNGS